MPTLNPFKSYKQEDFADVHVPLAYAPRHPSVIAENRRRQSSVAATRHGDEPTHQNLKHSIEGAQKDERHSKAGGRFHGVSSDDTSEAIFTLDQLRAEVEADISASGHDSAYDRKAKVINKAIQDIGMGRYQWQLFVLCGFGWLADNLWLQGVALTLPSLSNEFGLSSTNVRYTTLSLFAGLCVGAMVWGTISDVIGRRPAFNMTLLICSIFGIAVGGSNSWVQVCAIYAAMGVGVGGNLPVDGALFLEFLPFESGNLLTMLSVWWPFGQLLGSLMAWGYLTAPSMNCAVTTACSLVAANQPCCTKQSNMGWRYLNYTMGGFTFFMFICRFFLFHLLESPKFLLSKGRQHDAVAVVKALAYSNNSKTWLTEEILDGIAGTTPLDSKDGNNVDTSGKLSTIEVLRRTLSKFSGDRIRPLFSSKRLGINTLLLWFIWAAIGMGYPLFNAFLPQYLRTANPDAPPQPNSIVYRNYAIESIVGCPGSIIACFTVDVRLLGRKGTMAISTFLTGVFLFLFTTSTSSSFQLGFSCVVAFFQNIMYGVLYAYSPETFPAPNRGTGSGIASFFNRAAGLCAPVVAIRGATGDVRTPIYASGALMLAAFVAMCGLPIETRGKQLL